MSQFTAEVASRALGYRTTRTGEPIVRFSDGIGKVAISLETRTDEQLENDGRLHPDPVVREQALYNLIHRNGAQALSIVESAVLNDPDPMVRINVLWAIEHMDSERVAR